MKRFIVFALASCASSAPPSPSSAPEALPTTTASSPVPIATDKSAPFPCGGVEPRIVNRRNEPVNEAMRPGQMTEQAAAAKRLYDAERWSEAADALERVSNGASGDDAGNRAIAEYHRAIALFRDHRYPEAASSFRAIALERGHLKHQETLLWLAKLVLTGPDVVDLDVFAAYDVGDIERFRNAAQMEVYYDLAYLLGRERMREGARAEALALLSRIPNDHPFANAAARCAATLR